MCKWIDHPELYYPEPVTLRNCMRWHLALDELIDDAYRIANAQIYGDQDSESSPRLHALSEFKTSSSGERLRDRDRQFFLSLGYVNVALIETAILIGRELWYKDHSGTTATIPDKYLRTISIRDLRKWAAIFDIPLVEKKENDIRRAYDYAFSKNSKFLRAYINRLGLSK